MTLRDLLTKDKILQGLRSALSPAVLGMLPTEVLIDVRAVLNSGIGSIEHIIEHRRDIFNRASSQER